MSDKKEILNLDEAKPNQEYIMQDGKIALFIGFDKKLKRQYIFRVRDYIITRMRNGRHCDTCDGIVYPAIIEKVK